MTSESHKNLLDFTRNTCLSHSHPYGTTIRSLRMLPGEKLVQPNKTAAGILLPETTKQLNSAKVIAVGPGGRDRDGKLVPVSLKEGDTVLLPEYGGTEVKLAEKEYLLFGEHDILGRLEE